MREIVSQKKRWTEEDNQMLNEGVQKFGFKWQLVANFMETRTPGQCVQRWKRIKQKMQKKDSVSWTQEEIAKLRMLVKDYGKKWPLIAEMLGNKTTRQVRDKYLNKLDPKIQQQPWTQEEDDILYQNFLLHGCKWTLIKSKLPSRSESMVKNRFYNNIRYTHLKLQNPYNMMNNQINPYDEIQMYRQKVIESQKFSVQETFEEEDYQKFLNIHDDFSQNYMYDI